jgi:hypothetical protein
MTDMFPTWMESLSASEQHRVTLLLVLAITLILIYLFRRSLRYGCEEYRIIRAARKLGARTLRDVRLPDGMGGEISVDLLALAEDAILVVGIKRYDGFIFGSAQTDEWTQTIRNRSYRFPNPDVYLKRQVGAVRILVPGIPVRGIHLFADCALFPRDKPANVMHVNDLRGVRRPGLKCISPELLAAWKQLLESLESPARGPSFPAVAGIQRAEDR